MSPCFGDNRGTFSTTTLERRDNKPINLYDFDLTICQSSINSMCKVTFMDRDVIFQQNKKVWPLSLIMCFIQRRIMFSLTWYSQNVTADKSWLVCSASFHGSYFSNDISNVYREVSIYLRHYKINAKSFFTNFQEQWATSFYKGSIYVVH